MVAALLVLTFCTGVIDAVGFLGLDRVFAANMTGNIVLLGLGLIGAEELPVIGPLGALLAFLAGAAIVGRILRGAHAPWGRGVHLALVLPGLMVTATGIVVTVFAPIPHGAWLPTVTALLGLAMGTQAAAARHIAVSDLTTIVVTGTMVAFAADSRIAGRRPQPTLRRITAIVAIGVGAICGALVERAFGVGPGMALAGVLALGAAVCVRWALGRPSRG